MTLLEATRTVSFGLVVLIWLVQLVIYPAFIEIEPVRFLRWHAEYTRAVTWVVAPLMFGQVFLLAWLMVTRPSPPVFVAVALVAVAWVSTFVLAVPAHGRLGVTGQDEAEILRLIANNWIRTVVWSLAFVALLFIGRDEPEPGSLRVVAPGLQGVLWLLGPKRAVGRRGPTEARP